MKNQRIVTGVLFAVLVLSLLGMVDSGYLTYEHFSQGPISCLGLEGCETVTKSQYSQIFGIPVASLGFLYYLSLFAAAVLLSSKYKRNAVFFIRSLVSLGLLFSIWFVYAQIFLINAICIYCMISAGITLTLSILSWLLPLDDGQKVV